jgi:beta-1,4-mannosyl-glycoprotein beta-1,4-N-acetylglucosaminyltransferase
MTVYSCSLFFNEFDLLELKLETLWNVVDCFIISESPKTHSGKDKLLNLIRNQSRFGKYWSKLKIYGILDTPDNFDNLQEDPNRDELYNLVIRKVNSQKHRHCNLPHYGRDCFEKESLIRWIKTPKPNDIILLSDLDEIARPEKVKEVLDNFDPNQIYFLHHIPYYYYMNIRKEEDSFGTIVLSYENFLKQSFSAMREEKQGIQIQNAGWHFTYMGDVRTKLESFSHQEFNTETIKNRKFDLNSGKDIFGYPARFWKVPIIYETHPKYLVDNLEKFKEYIKCS